MKQRRFSVWAAGRAPACWQDAIERQTTRTKKLRCLCAWVQPLSDVTPKLRQGPLLGNCLAALTNSAASTDELRAAERPRPGSGRSIDQADRAQATVESQPTERPRPGLSRLIDPADHAQYAAQATGDAPKQSAIDSTRDTSPRANPLEPIGLARQIDRARLSRWADAKLREQPGHAASPHQPIVPAAKSEMSSAALRLDTAAQRRSPAFSPTFISREQHGRSMNVSARPARLSLESQHAWLQRLAQRALRVQPMVGPTEPRMVAAFVTHWAEHLDGRTVSMDLLTEWAELRPRLLEGEQRAVQADRGEAPPPDRSSPSTATRSPTAASSSADQRAGRGETVGVTTDRSVATQAPEAGYEQTRAAASAFSTPYSSISEAAHANAVEYALPVHIAPPAIAQALPQLLPQTAREISPAVAANLAQHGAAREAIEAGVDLARLAANVKRILDEEARRYGIDV